jgi:hypothetical protein
MIVHVPALFDFSDERTAAVTAVQQARERKIVRRVANLARVALIKHPLNPLPKLACDQRLMPYAELFADLQKVEATLQRSVNPTFLSFDDWRRKLATKDSVIAKIATQPKLFIFGSETDLKHRPTAAQEPR